MRKHRHVALAGAVAAVALLSTGCGSETPDIAPAGNHAAADNGYGSAKGSKGESKDVKWEGTKKVPPARTLSVTANRKVGQLVTDAKGMTLYRFDEDKADPPKSNCDGQCTKAWPPVPATDAKASRGVDAGQLGKVKRSDGSWQLTLGGWPVYRYEKDTKAGDVKGQGIGDTWSALAADGKKASLKTATQLKPVADQKLGKVLTDVMGHTLYRSDKDSAWPMKSNCTGACSETWKPAKPVDKRKVHGVAQKLIGTYVRPDGTKQLEINCWPVYWFTGDTKPGDTNGQGKMGLWHAVTDQGKKAGVTP